MARVKLAIASNAQRWYSLCAALAMTGFGKICRSERSRRCLRWSRPGESKHRWVSSTMWHASHRVILSPSIRAPQMDPVRLSCTSTRGDLCLALITLNSTRRLQVVTLNWKHQTTRTSPSRTVLTAKIPLAPSVVRRSAAMLTRRSQWTRRPSAPVLSWGTTRRSPVALGRRATPQGPTSPTQGGRSQAAWTWERTSKNTVTQSNVTISRIRPKHHLRWTPSVLLTFKARLMPTKVRLYRQGQGWPQRRAS